MGGRYLSAAVGGEYFPASSSEKSLPWDAKRMSLISGPWQSDLKNWGVARDEKLKPKKEGMDRRRDGRSATSGFHRNKRIKIFIDKIGGSS
jgi:hypothetical protein